MVFFTIVENGVARIGSVSSSDAYAGFVLQGQIGSYLASRGRLVSSFPSSPKNPPTITVQGNTCPRRILCWANKTFEMIFPLESGQI
jgi:hypothetical protein